MRNWKTDVTKRIEKKKTVTTAQSLTAKNLLDWINKYGYLDGTIPLQYDHAPFWRDILEDDHNDISCLCSRQTYKSTVAARILGYYSTTVPSSVCSYIVDDEGRKADFSEKRLRLDLFESNDTLMKFLPFGHQASINRTKLTNKSIVRIMTDHGKFKHIEGAANTVLIFDEKQKQDLQYQSVALATLTATRGRLYSFGIGGEDGSEWYRQWRQTDQRKWFYNDTSDYTDKVTGKVWPLQGWRHNITRDDKGNITNSKEDLKKILAGKWVPQKPENTDYRGYAIQQSMFPTVPLTISEARNDFHEHPGRSYEWKKKKDPQSLFIPHTEGGFYKSSRRPITPDMVRGCYDYTLSLLTPADVAALKNKYQNEIAIYLGVDWGKGPGKTVGCVLIHWRKLNRFQIGFIDPRPEEDTTESAVHFVKLFHEYKCDFCIVDWGYGQSAVPIMMYGGTDIHGNDTVGGLGRGRCIGCYTMGSRVQEDITLPKEVDKEGTKQKDHFIINKVDVMQNFIDFVGQKVEVANEDGEMELVSQLVIPMLNEWECDFLLDDFCDVERDDITDEEDEEDHRTVSEKSFAHPKDSVMAIIYAKKCADRNHEDKYKIFPVGRTGRSIKMNRGLGRRYKN